MKRVIIAPHMRCNARCAHCCVSSHPRDTRQLSDEHVFRIVDEAIKNSEIKCISFTGGEALLRKEFILTLIRKIATSGKQTTLVSNGFWGITPNIAHSQLLELRDAGLNLLTLSADMFHLPYIPIERIRNILQASRKVSNLQINLNMCESTSYPADMILNQLKSYLDGVRITVFPATPVGNAINLPETEFQYNNLSTDKLQCPGHTLLFASDDRVYPCCSTGVMNSALSVGRTSELTITDAKRRIENNLLFGIIQAEGLNWIVEQYRQLGIEKFKHPFNVVDACHLCCEIFADQENLEKIRPALINYRNSYIVETQIQQSNK